MTSPANATLIYSENSGRVIPYLASISRFGVIFSCGRSICCSTFRSAIPGIPSIAPFISLPKENILFKSSPKSLIAILAFVPDSIASIRWLIGWPISIFAPVIVPSFSRTSAMSSLRERSFSSNGASISEVFTPRACSSSSARPVLRATVCISGIVNSNISARCPILLLSSREIPGSEDILMVNEPSLKGGKKERPNVKKHPKATINRAMVLPNVIRL